MPSADAIHQGLTTIANQWRWLALGWHAALAILALGVVRGWRPSTRAVALLLAVPVLSVSMLAWVASNPFTVIVCGLLAATLVLLAFRLREEPAALSSRPLVGLGAALVAFGWTYPHFLHASAWTAYLYEAPLGLVPCPTLSLVVGVSLILGSLGSRIWAAVVACAGLLYGAIGAFALGVTIDLVLVVGSLALGATALKRTSAIGRRPSSIEHRTAA